MIAETRWIKAGDLARLLGLAEDEVTRYLPADLLDGLDYLSLDDAEAGAVRKRALRIVRDPKLTAAGPAMIGRWERGWGEILERVRRQGVSEASLARNISATTCCAWAAGISAPTVPGSNPAFMPQCAPSCSRTYLRGLIR
ncbi:MAG: hypothetical protein QGH73_10760 [Rhodospirillales bacterium]|nr:hypothetical protein [Rhodospirillales bacterium]